MGLREVKKARTREHIADAAAALFAEHGYDVVTMLAVARAADVSDQTVYNYFPAKQDLVLDLAEQFRAWYHDAVAERDESTSPSGALRPLLQADIERYRAVDLDEARGQFLAQSVASPTLRRFTLEERERQVTVIADAITATTPALPRIVIHAHAAAIVAVIQALHDDIGRCVLDRSPQKRSATAMSTTLATAFESLDQTFSTLLDHAKTPPTKEALA